MIPGIIDCNLKQDYRILTILGTNILDTTGHQTTVQVSTLPNFASALPGKTEQAKYALKWIKNVNKCHFSQQSWLQFGQLVYEDYNVYCGMQQRVYQTPFRNVAEFKKWLVEVWSRTLSTLLWMNGDSVCVPVFAQMTDILNIYCKELDTEHWIDF